MLISFVASRSVILRLTTLILAYLRVVYYKFTMLLVTNPPPWTGNSSNNRGLLGLSTRKFIQHYDLISFFTQSLTPIYCNINSLGPTCSYIS
jgi:hypothetical protein